MKLTIDDTAQELLIETLEGSETIPLYSDRAFELLSAVHVKVGWNQKYSYGFTWLGRPIIQLPEDAFRIQELVFRIKPDVIIETGVAHGGSIIFYASLTQLLGRGRVIGVDIEIRPKNRAAIEQHPLFDRIDLIEGSSTSAEVVEAVRRQIAPGETTLILLDSNHSYDHVCRELGAYAPMVSVGSYIVAMDGVMQDLADVPRGRPEWDRDNPARAARDFAAQNSDFVLEEPAPMFRENTLTFYPTYWPDAYLRRVR